MKIVKLKPKGKYHFGESGLEDSSLTFHSDSLFSAIVNNYVALYGEKNIEKLESLTISSVFPAFNNVFFIPKPFTKLNFDKKEQEKIEKKHKKIKEIEFISLNALKNHNEGTLKFDENLIIDKKFLVTKEDNISKENTKIISSFSEEKIEIDRNKGTTAEGQLFNVEYIKLAKGGYFYFILDDSKLDNDIKKNVYAAIRLIEDEGLGGERTTGAGLFEEVEFIDNSIIDKCMNSNYPYNMSLSLTLPKDENEFKKSISYYLIERKGYIYRSTNTTKRKKSIRMLSEGSIFSGKIEGKIENVSPENAYKVYKYGKFFGMPINIKQEENQENEHNT